MKQKTLYLPVAILLVCLADASAQDWPQYLGPHRNSTSPQQDILRSWPEDGPEVLWTTAVGRGYGGPVVKEGRVYLLDRIEQVGDKLRCLDLSSGKELWNFSYDAPGAVQYPGSRVDLESPGEGKNSRDTCS